MKLPVKTETFIINPGRFFHYEPLFTISFRKNLIIPEAIMCSKDLSITVNLFFLNMLNKMPKLRKN